MIVITPDRLAEADPAQLASARECVIAIAGANVAGRSAAALLFSDYAVMTPAASITLDGALAWAGVIWRVGDRALRLHVSATRTRTIPPVKALELGLIDEIAADADQWRRRFFDGRSAMALDSAAMLIDRRGGDALERAEFARLFGTGEPQRGLRFFLEKRRPQF
jgi:enoyl-CoA hydratase/carnithine racemase